ncbi:MAG: Acetylglutamate kinase [Microgenomates group bacterium GW2011_GWC1_37_8]|uniref:Isopentenyl phosphate kinase n=1 Tax=Candidatus Woesebacteria bacterium GW2011_GWB1_38_8 TaxID=1618570 RepID=A0A0G0L4M5_9BACT|nr:MAG: Acetylglutamate kinase [Microgenomates group bacterium GW2011_GWC1_37_8]KKQ85982.1 MAG: Acetylglutamate kinase [Candidatus Woesebacteria bacterium GW2011_GWB1_38_8]
MTKNIKILKVGGSVITYKNKDSELNIHVVKQIAKDIFLWLRKNKSNQLIFTAGAGSFGHPLAYKYQLNAESLQKDPFGFVLTTTNMQNMANRVARIFHYFKVPLFPIMPSSIFMTNKGRIISAYIDTINEALNRGLTPFLWGDTVIDRSHTFRILSGDQINPYIVENLKVKELYFGTNVDGIYDSDPLKNHDATQIKKINDDNYKSILTSISESGNLDVTKGMRGKVEEIHRIKVRPLKCIIFNALIKGNTYKALSGQKVGTKIKFE